MLNKGREEEKRTNYGQEKQEYTNKAKIEKFITENVTHNDY